MLHCAMIAGQRMLRSFARRASSRQLSLCTEPGLQSTTTALAAASSRSRRTSHASPISMPCGAGVEESGEAFLLQRVGYALRPDDLFALVGDEDVRHRATWTPVSKFPQRRQRPASASRMPKRQVRSAQASASTWTAGI
jgi:hypothetical protein